MAHFGKLKEVKDGEFKCPGGYDDDKYVRCSWKGSEEDIERPAWKVEDGCAV